MANTPWLPILPSSPVPCLTGIARLAAQGESLREGHNVEYFDLESRSLLSRCTSRRGLPFTWAINPYRGCEFACKYCYARYTHEFMELREPADFERKIFVEQHAAEMLRRELRKVKAGEEIAIGTATDPYQPAERRYEVTRAILEELARHQGLELGIVTKSNLVLRDVELLREIGRNNRIFINVTITTMDADLARILEPRAPRPDLRMETVRQLNLAGVASGVLCCPVLPEITDSHQNLEAVVEAAAAAKAKYVAANPLFLKPCSAAVFLPFLQENFPHLVDSYRERFGDRAFLNPAYGKRIALLMTSLRRKHGITAENLHASVRTHPPLAAQLALFG